MSVARSSSHRDPLLHRGGVTGREMVLSRSPPLTHRSKSPSGEFHTKRTVVGEPGAAPISQEIYLDWPEQHA